MVKPPPFKDAYFVIEKDFFGDRCIQVSGEFDSEEEAEAARERHIGERGSLRRAMFFAHKKVLIGFQPASEKRRIWRERQRMKEGK